MNMLNIDGIGYIEVFVGNGKFFNEFFNGVVVYEVGFFVGVVLGNYLVEKFCV